MWGRGDQAEAVRWVRRAAEAASDAGSDERALVLARAAADLTNALAIPPSVTPPPVASAPATPVPAAVRPPPPPVAPLNPDEATLPRELPMMRPKPPPRTPPDEKTVLDYSIPSGVAEAERKKPAPSRRPPPPSRSGPSAAPPPLRSSPSAAPPPAAPSSRSAPSAAPPPLRSSPSAAPPPVSNAPPSSRSAPPTRSSPGASRDAHRTREALRVAVTPSPDDRNTLIVRLLADDEPAPTDAHEALLVALDPRAHLTHKKR